MLAQRSEDASARSRYPNAIARDGKRDSARTAWCYGDPGVALALASVPATREAGFALARECAARPPERTGVVDPNLCHGAAGLAHIFNRLGQASGDSGLCDAAIHWYERTLAMQDRGVALPFAAAAVRRQSSFRYAMMSACSWAVRAGSPTIWK